MDSADIDHRLATLISIFEERPIADLLVSLQAHNGDLEQTIESLVNPLTTSITASTESRNIQKGQPNRKRVAIEHYFGPPDRSGDGSSTSDPTQHEPPSKRLKREESDRKRNNGVAENEERNAFDLLKWDDDKVSSGKRLPVQTLKNPEEISAKLPCCELYPNFLPADVADRLLIAVLEEAKQWSQHKFVINEKPVVSHHQSCLYVSSSESLATKTVIYGGETYTENKAMLTEMEEIRVPIEDKVNERLIERDRYLGEIPCRWRANALVANCYDNETQGVGFHADRLTQIGVMPTIASMTLGATRAFRLRRIINAGNPMAQTIDLLLPHNSLLVMFPPCQELWKHSVPPQKSVIRHPISGLARINLTYRHYRLDYTDGDTPRCHCGNPCDLKPVMKKEGRIGRYFYMLAGFGSQDPTG
ncbi:hypothetical protein SeLEV6574_g02681 [Synchytrium endobioticum]|uniref:Fe2OG dioxygenase domain-containing protein n=1 Tax=Synchytrium endobioticum TaxID=286115 RepID=A0A507D7W2_9FUNG|nr:hypothetical protein SeLEV6574_g02681 [Synchytrium endobioticum]